MNSQTLSAKSEEALSPIEIENRVYDILSGKLEVPIWVKEFANEAIQDNILYWTSMYLDAYYDNNTNPLTFS